MLFLALHLGLTIWILSIEWKYELLGDGLGTAGARVTEEVWTGGQGTCTSYLWHQKLGRQTIGPSCWRLGTPYLLDEGVGSMEKFGLSGQFWGHLTLLTSLFCFSNFIFILCVNDCFVCMDKHEPVPAVPEEVGRGCWIFGTGVIQSC